MIANAHPPRKIADDEDRPAKGANLIWQTTLQAVSKLPNAPISRY
jgi:hypothetical protein